MTDKDGAVDPFKVRWHFTSLDWVKMAVIGVTLAPLRIISLFITVILCWVIASIGLYKMDHSKPVTGYRAILRKVLAFLGRLCCRCVGFHTVHKIGEQAPKEVAPILVVAPHSTFFDGLASFFTGMPYVISREENGQIPFIGKCIEFSQAISVNREDPESRHRTVQEIYRRVTSDEPWPQFIIFPEGATSNRKALMSFKPGGFIPGRTVQPVLIRYGNKHDLVSWTWDQPHGAVAIFFASLCQWRMYAELEFLPPYEPSPAEVADSRLFADNVRRLMADSLGVPLCDVTYADLKAKYGRRRKVD